MLSFENSAMFSVGKEPEVSLRNFWAPEDGFVWSTGKWCEIAFQFDFGSRPVGALAELIVDLEAFRVEERFEGQNFLFYINGLRIGSLYCLRRGISIFAFDANVLQKDENLITIDTPDSGSPSQFGGGDKRVLGVKIFSLQIRRVG